MQWPGLRDWIFTVKTFAAALLALAIALNLGLDRPYWAMASAYIASQPLSGATRSKAVYRLIGTFAGATAALLLVPALADAPPVLCLVLALWVAGCLYLSLLDRTPRSYVCMLAGYTAAIIGFPSVTAPDAIFDTALTRVEEIALGVTLASMVASVVFPRRVGAALTARIDAWLANAKSWSLDVLAGRETDAANRLAADGVEINLLASHLSYDATLWETQSFGLLRARMIILLPELSSIADRIAALQPAIPAPVAGLIAAVSDWIASTPGEPPDDLLARIEAAERATGHTDWYALLVATLLIRLRALVQILADCDTLRRQMATATQPTASRLLFAPEATAASAWHRDHGMAALSAFACAVAILLTCAVWIDTAWNEGYIAAEMVAVACSFFAAQDDPVPSIMQFLFWSVVGVIVDGILLFAVLPAASNFVTLALALAPPFLIGGLLVAMPATANGGRAFTANAATLLALQSSYAADFPSFVNTSLAFLLGLVLAALVTRLIRSVGAAFIANRLRGTIRRELAVAAENRGAQDRARYAGLMLDRFGLLAPRLAEAEQDAAPINALADIRIGLNVIDLRRARHGLSAPVRARIDIMLDGLAAFYRDRRTPNLLPIIDDALSAVIDSPGQSGGPDALLGLVGIRRGLFPTAPPAELRA